MYIKKILYGIDVNVSVWKTNQQKSYLQISDNSDQSA